MKKILLFAFFVISLFGFNSNQIVTTIISSNDKNATLNQNIQIGMTGYVIHNDMMIAKAVSIGNSHIKYLPLVKLKNNATATPKIFPQVGDNVIFGLYNFRGLIIAPNQQQYSKIKNKYPNINFINPDIFATYFYTKPTKEDFQKFCRDFNVGIIDFVLDKEYIVDCESFYVLDSNNTQPQKYIKPFYTTYVKLSNSLFSTKQSNWVKYYKSLLKVANGN